MLDRHGNAEPDSARSLPGICQEPMLNHQRTGFETRILSDDLLVHIQQRAHRTIPDGMGADLPTPAHREVGQSKEVVRVPEQMSPVAWLVHIRFVERPSLRSTVQDELESPELEEVISKATVYSKALDDRHPFCKRVRKWREHESTANGQLPLFPQRLVDRDLIPHHHRITHGSNAVGVVLPAGQLQALHHLFRRHGWYQCNDA